MLFTIIHKYAKEVKDCCGEELLGINKSQWHKYKKENYLPLKHCKTLSSLFNYHITDDFKELSKVILEKYYEEVSSGN